MDKHNKDSVEKRRSLIYQDKFWQLLGFIAMFIIALGAWGYNDLKTTKADKEIVTSELKALKDGIKDGFESLRREIRTALSGGTFQ